MLNPNLTENADKLARATFQFVWSRAKLDRVPNQAC